MPMCRTDVARGFLLACATLAACAAQPPAASQGDVQKQLDALRSQVNTMQKDLDEIKALLAPLRGRQQPPGSVALDLGNRPMRGAPGAKLTLVELTDYQWTFCIKYVRETYPQIEKAYVQTGRLRYAVMDLPLESIHSAAFRGAEMVRCAAEQGKYWEMRERLFDNPRSIGEAGSHAAALGLDAQRLDGCLASGKFAGEIRSDMEQAQNAGVQGTPSFFLAVSDPATGKLKPVRFITGAQPFANFKQAIDAALAEAGGAPGE